MLGTGNSVKGIGRVASDHQENCFALIGFKIGTDHMNCSFYDPPHPCPTVACLEKKDASVAGW